MGDYYWYHYILMLAAGWLAGIINTLAGSGSVFILSAFLFLGLPADVANATNRVGVVAQGLLGTYAFYQHQAFPIREGKPFMLPTVLGAILGALFATRLDAQAMEWAIGGVMAVLLVLILFPPPKKITDKLQGKGWIIFILFVVVGFYGGFIQAGIGIFLTIALNVAGRFSLVQANALKVLMVLVFSLPSLAVYVWQSEINWLIGGVVAIGQGIGSYMAGSFAAKKGSSIEKMVKALLILMIVFTLLKTFGLLDFI